MKYKKLKISAVLLLGLGLTGVQAQTMYVKESVGTQTAYTLSTIRKMYFSSGNLIVSKTDNSNSMYALSGMRYLSFADFATGMTEPGTTEKIEIRTYPNPVSNILYFYFSGTVNQTGTIHILSLEGRIMNILQVAGSGIISVDISPLPKGIYICHYSNGTEIKTVKIIKQ